MLIKLLILFFGQEKNIIVSIGFVIFILELFRLKHDFNPIDLTISILALVFFVIFPFFAEKFSQTNDFLPSNLDYKAYKIFSIDHGETVEFRDKKTPELIIAHMTKARQKKELDGRLIYFLTFIPETVIDKKHNIFVGNEPIEVEIKPGQIYLTEFLHLNIFIRIEQIFGKYVVVFLGVKRIETPPNINVTNCLFVKAGMRILENHSNLSQQIGDSHHE